MLQGFICLRLTTLHATVPPFMPAKLGPYLKSLNNKMIFTLSCDTWDYNDVGGPNASMPVISPLDAV